MGMNKNIRLLWSIAAGVAAIPAGWAADLLLCGPSQFGALLAATNTLVLLP
jgi:hypothetical protein